MSKHEKNASKLCQKFKNIIYYVAIVLCANFHGKTPTKT